MDLMFSDLKEDAQKRILELFNIKDPREMNWDVVPITVIAAPEDDDLIEDAVY